MVLGGAQVREGCVTWRAAPLRSQRFLQKKEKMSKVQWKGLSLSIGPSQAQRIRPRVSLVVALQHLPDPEVALADAGEPNKHQHR